MQLKIGTALTLEPTYTDRVEKFRCKIVEQENNIIYIDYPVNTLTNKTAFLVDGAQFRATFVSEDKVSYAFNTEVLGRKLGNIPTILLSCPPIEDFVKIQRREFVRVNTSVDIALDYNNKFYQFVTEDISAGGLAIHFNKEFPFNEGESVNLTIVLPFMNGEIRYVKTAGSIIRIIEKNRISIASLQFTDTEDIDKQYIVRFCFERQLLNRRKLEANTTN
ncbi:flagellar brake protein [Ureibacillus chungkukjangi]|uniref:C-di-GMP-binding flagellar brake protein YcgR n=1 Tax=Ureibacillus chungkukjangi TaxID=1202712 RepID=A0A318TMT9_9BACL|nr:flagellar brake domain-containing protein [Ureibacillus chungkukjangi]PYF05813.1 c-di-GMP-binding flagellar brake protein YcgR [Ureibacillus chungkukjangi]